MDYIGFLEVFCRDRIGICWESISMCIYINIHIMFHLYTLAFLVPPQVLAIFSLKTLKN